MYTEKTQQKSPSRTIQSKPGGGRVYMEDNRPEAVGQAKMINEIEGCPNKDLPAQFYTIKKIKGKKYKFSENENYITGKGKNEGNVLYCSSKVKVPGGFPNLPIESKIEVEGYNAYKYNIQSGFNNDCGRFARFLCQQIKGRSSSFNLYPRLTHEKNEKNMFEYWAYNQIGPLGGGNTDKKKEGREDFSQDENANPEIGEAYFIGRSKKLPASLRGTGLCRHHVAAVIAKDGSDNITCEADAGKEDANEPVFDMYGTKTDTEENRAQTFHFTYRESYSSKGEKGIRAYEAVTGVAGLPIEEGLRSEDEVSKKKRRYSKDSDDEVSEKKRKLN